MLSLLATSLVPSGLAQEEPEEALRQAEKSRQEYLDTFRDLTAVETWVTEILNTNGTIDKRRTVVSDFFVYRSRFKNDVVSREREGHVGLRHTGLSSAHGRLAGYAGE